MRGLLALLFAMPALCAQVPEKEAALGRALEADVRRRTTPVEDSMLLRYAESVAGRLGGDVRISLVAGGEREPIALPGGSIFVPVGLFTAARDEAEFAGMLAHAMAHVALFGARVPGDPAIPLVFVGSADECFGPPAARKHEHEADRLAAGNLAAAGYDPAGWLSYLGRIGRRCDPSRLADLEKAIRDLRHREYQPESAEFATAREEAQRLTAKPLRRAPSLDTKR